jgi:hypothetical protein
MNKNDQTTMMVVPDEVVMNKIYVIRGLKVMLDGDLSELYGVETKRLKEQVRRNIERFPADFMFELSDEEYKQIKTHFMHPGRGEHSKYRPFAFTEHGVLMLSTVLNSERAIKVNIQVMRAYVRLRERLILHKDILHRLDGMESKLAEYDDKIMLLFKYINQFEKLKQIEFEQKKRPPIGFKQSN